MQLPTIEILLAVYNGERFLDEQLRSLIGQTYSNIRILIRDNCSTDGTLALLEQWRKQYPEKIEILTSNRNVGVIGNFAALAQASKAPYVMFCDCDDVWLPTKVEITFAKMRELEGRYGNEKPLLVHTDLKIVDRHLNEIAPSFWQYSGIHPNEKAHLFQRLIVQNVVTGCTSLANRSLIDRSLPIPDNIVMHDWWLGLVASAFGRIETIPDKTLLYRQHGNNDTGAKKYSILTSIKKRFKKPNRAIGDQHEMKKYLQVQEFLSRYQQELPDDIVQKARGYLSMQSAPFLKKLFLTHKHGFYRNGFMRNVSMHIPRLRR